MYVYILRVVIIMGMDASHVKVWMIKYYIFSTTTYILSALHFHLAKIRSATLTDDLLPLPLLLSYHPTTDRTAVCKNDDLSACFKQTWFGGQHCQTTPQPTLILTY